MTTKRIVTAFILIACLSGCGEKRIFPASRLQQPIGNFSFVTPEGWSRTKLAGIDFIIVSTKPDSGISPNIFVDFVRSSAQLSNTVAEVVKTNHDKLLSYQVLQQGNFITESGLTGVKLTASRLNKESLPLAMFHYFIQDDDRTIAITCICADATKSKYEPVFDSAIKSLRSEKPTSKSTNGF